LGTFIRRKDIFAKCHLKIIVGILLLFFTNACNQNNSKKNPLPRNMPNSELKADIQKRVNPVKEKLNTWLKETIVYVPIDSIRPLGNKDVDRFNFEKKNLLNELGAEKIEDNKLNDWRKIQLNKFIRYAGDEQNKFYFSNSLLDTEDYKFYNMRYQVFERILFFGSIYGNDILYQLYSKLNLLVDKKYTQKLILKFGPTTYELFWKDRLFVSTTFFDPTAMVRPHILSYNRTSSFQPPGLPSISVRDYIDLPDNFTKRPWTNYEETASNFMINYYSKLFPKNAELISKAPPTIYLTQIKGYVTKQSNYWENVQVKIDNLQVIDKKLLIQCSIDGEYLKINTPSIEPSAFDRSFSLERDYSNEIQSIALDLIGKFKQFLLKRTNHP